MARELTGRKVFVIAASAFAVIIGVNLTMAFQAVRTFPGLEVRNSYVASQVFDAERAAQQKLGWTLDPGYAQGRLTLVFRDAAGRPADVERLTATVGRTTEAADDVTPEFTYSGGVFSAPVALEPGKWMLLLEAFAPDGTRFHQRIDLFVKG
ncbi:MAG: FixH family protein [Rhodobacteraceae bacterium]|nr:FixH family protein [Paracoccaceae bacterium]MCP5342415.1 FixH family protein [Paracoccaceae bacterium]